jgi:hypothetical protein
MITMTNTVATVHGGSRLRAGSVVPAFERAWKRPSVVILGGFGTDNSTGVSAEERRHL